MNIKNTCNFAIFGTNFTEIGNVVHHFGNVFCTFLDWEGADIWPQNRPMKIPDLRVWMGGSDMILSVESSHIILTHLLYFITIF